MAPRGECPAGSSFANAASAAWDRSAFSPFWDKSTLVNAVHGLPERSQELRSGKGLWSFVMVYHVFRWLIILHDGLGWLVMLYDDVWWLLMAYHGLWWCMMDYHGLSWCMMMFDGLWMFIMFSDGLSLFMMVYDGLSFFMHAYLVDFFHAYSWFIIFVIDIVHHGLWCFMMVYCCLSLAMVIWSCFALGLYDHVKVEMHLLKTRLGTYRLYRPIHDTCGYTCMLPGTQLTCVLLWIHLGWGTRGHDMPGVHEFTSIVEKSQAAVNVLSWSLWLPNSKIVQS